MRLTKDGRKINAWSDEEKEFLKKNSFGKSAEEVKEIFNEKFHKELSIKQIKGALDRFNIRLTGKGRDSLSEAPWNKGTKGISKANQTSFKKGQTPTNCRAIGSERLARDGYIEVKVAKNKWKVKHRVLYEKYYGPIPEGKLVYFLDKDKTNFSKENLALISKKDILLMGRYNLISENPELTKVGHSIASLVGAIKEKERF